MSLSPGMIDRILSCYAQHPGDDRDLLIQLEQDSNPAQATGFRFWFYVSDGFLSLRVLMSPALASLVPKGANDCCLWQRDAQKKKWRRVTDLPEDLITTWQARESAPTLTPLSMTNLLWEDEHAKLWRQLLPADQVIAPCWVSKRLTDLFGQTVLELRQYQYELIPQQVVRIMCTTKPIESAAHPSKSPVSGFLDVSHELDGGK